jgi:DNA ligase (NAD+)
MELIQVLQKNEATIFAEALSRFKLKVKSLFVTPDDIFQAFFAQYEVDIKSAAFKEIIRTNLSNDLIPENKSSHFTTLNGVKFEFQIGNDAWQVYDPRADVTLDIYNFEQLADVNIYYLDGLLVTSEQLAKLKSKIVANKVKNPRMEQLNANRKLADTMPLPELAKLLRESEEAYYNAEEEEDMLEDLVYDYAKQVYRARRLEENDGGSDSEGETGMEHVPKNVRTLKLPIWMGSLDKVEPDSGKLALWTANYTGPYVISAKLDGASALYWREKGKYKLFSRGDGAEGQDISEYLHYVKLPELPEGVFIRGEMIIPKALFEKKWEKNKDRPNGLYKNSRNGVAGMVNRLGARAAGSARKEINLDFIRDIQFVPYEVIRDPPMPCLQQFEYLESLFGNNVAVYEVLDKVDDAILSSLYDEYVSEIDYEMDGLVLCDNNVHERPYGKNPDYQRAFKKPLETLTAVTEVIEVNWSSVSKDGRLNPVVLFQPIALPGITNVKATGYNAKFIVSKGIGPGAIIEVIRSGGTIPKIIKVIQAAEPQLPTVPYHWSDSKVFIIMDHDDEDEFSESRRNMNVAKLYYFLDTLGAKGVGEKTVEKIYDAGFLTILDVIQASADDLKFLGPKTSQKVVETIYEVVHNANMAEMMAASGAFGSGLGVKSYISILKTYPDLLEMDVVQDNDVDEIVRLIQEVDGFAEKTSRKVAEGMAKFLEFLLLLDEIGITVKSYEAPVAVKSSGRPHELAGKNVAFTGFREKKGDQPITDFLARIGANLQSSMTNSTNVLIIKDESTRNNKTAKAEQKGVTVYTRQDFATKYL